MAAMTGRDPQDAKRSLRRLGLDEAEPAGGNFDDVPDDLGPEAPSMSIKASPMVSGAHGWKVKAQAEDELHDLEPKDGAGRCSWPSKGRRIGSGNG